MTETFMSRKSPHALVSCSSEEPSYGSKLSVDDVHSFESVESHSAKQGTIDGVGKDPNGSSPASALAR